MTKRGKSADLDHDGHVQGVGEVVGVDDGGVGGVSRPAQEVREGERGLGQGDDDGKSATHRLPECNRAAALGMDNHREDGEPLPVARGQQRAKQG